MNKDLALIIIYNHRYDDNIEILERIYSKRFSNIYHLMPFYDGEKSNVISVYENSYYFQGYIAQGLKLYFKEEYRHYLFIADDLLLNPEIDENNYRDYFRLKENSSYLTNLLSLHERPNAWPRIREAFEYRINKSGVEAGDELPAYNDARNIFEKFNLEIKPLKSDQIFSAVSRKKEGAHFLHKAVLFLGRKYSRLKCFLQGVSFELPYPIVGAYADIVIVPKKNIKKFCHYCGVLAATDLFVELALPTALVLSSDEIVIDKDLSLKGKTLWTGEDLKELEKFDYQLEKLLSDFPKECLYIHPVKLSKWVH